MSKGTPVQEAARWFLESAAYAMTAVASGEKVGVMEDLLAQHRRAQDHLEALLGLDIKKVQ